jgi:flagellin
MNAERVLTLKTKEIDKTMEKLASGMRINRGADDAANLAVSEKMRSQIRGLNQASKN